jgi:hypothetical protein
MRRDMTPHSSYRVKQETFLINGPKFAGLLVND